MEIKNGELPLPPMRIEGNRLIGLPSNYYLIFLGSIHDGLVYFTVIATEKEYYKSKDLISDALIATSMPNQNLEFKPVDSFVINGHYRNRWELLADKGSMKIVGLGEEACYGENRIPMQVLHSIFKREHDENIATVQTLCSHIKN